MTTPPMMTLTSDAMLYFDERANQALTQTRAAWFALGELMSGEPVLPGALEQATARYHEALMQLGLQALRTSYLNPPVDLPAHDEEEPDEEEEQAEPVAPQVRRAPSAPVAPAQPKTPEAAPMTARVVEPAPAKKPDMAQLIALKEQFGQPMSWADEADAATQTAHAARALDEQVRALCEEGVKGWRQGQVMLDKIGALVKEPRRWHVLDSADRVELLSALAAMIRHIDLVPLPQEHHTARKERVKQALAWVRQARRDSVDAIVHGLAVAHTPRHGGDWWQDARHILGLTAPVAPALAEPAPAKALTEPAPAKAQAAEVAAVPEAPRTNPYPHVKGQRWAVVGGDRRGERGDVLCELLELESLEWIDSAPGKHKHIGNVLKRMKRGSLDAVVVLKRYINHSATDRIIEEGKKHGVAVIWVDGGYGEQQLLAAIARHYPAR